MKVYGKSTSAFSFLKHMNILIILFAVITFHITMNIITNLPIPFLKVTGLRGEKGKKVKSSR